MSIVKSIIVPYCIPVCATVLGRQIIIVVRKNLFIKLSNKLVRWLTTRKLKTSHNYKTHTISHQKRRCDQKGKSMQ